MTKKESRPAGASLIEVILVTLMVAVIASLMGGSFSRITKIQHQARLRQHAFSLAQESVESFKTIPFGLLPVTTREVVSCDCDGPESWRKSEAIIAPQDITGGPYIFKRRVCISAIDLAGGAPAGTCSGSSTGLKRVVVSVDVFADRSVDAKSDVHIELERLVKDPLGREMALMKGRFELSGQLLSATSRAGLSARPVYLLDQSPHVVRVVLTDQDGRFRLSELPKADFQLTTPLYPSESTASPFQLVSLDGDPRTPHVVPVWEISGTPLPVTLKTNVDLAWVLCSHTPLANGPDPLRQDGPLPAETFSHLITSSEDQWTLPEGDYAIQCWNKSSNGPARFVVPREGGLRTVSVSVPTIINCIFP